MTSTRTAPDSGRRRPRIRRSSTGSASTPSGRCRWTRCRRPSRAIPARRWRSRPRRTCLWQRFLRYDPDDPRWPNRDRFVLSNGHASMLLYSLLHLAGVKAVNESYEEVGRAIGGDAGRHQELPPGGQPLPGPSGVRLDLGRRGDDRSAGAGGGDERRHGRGRPLARRHLQSSRLRAVRLQRLRLLRRRRHDGGGQLRGRLAGRPPPALQPLLDLRQQPDHASRARPPSPSPRTSPAGSWLTAGTCSGWATPTISTC